MNLLPHSNGVRRVNMKRKKNPKEKFQTALKIIVAILVLAFAFQWIVDFIDGEMINQRVEYTTVDDKRLDYRLNGSGSYTVVFDGALGTNLEAWTSVVKALEENGDNVTTFVYNRRGYGFSDSGNRRTIEEQAQDLKILLRKSGASGPFILVGEEYGSLVLTSFAEQFPDSVAGVVLIDPLVEDDLESGAVKYSNLFTNIRRVIEEGGSRIGVTLLLDKLGLDVNLKNYEDKLDEESLEEFKVLRTKYSYTSAVVNETKNLSSGLSNSQKQGVFAGKPYYLLLKSEDDRLEALGDADLTTVFITSETKKYLSLNATNQVLEAIRQVVKQCTAIDEKNK